MITTEALIEKFRQALKEKWGIPANYEGAGNIILGYGEPDGIRPAAPRKEGYIIRA